MGGEASEESAGTTMMGPPHERTWRVPTMALIPMRWLTLRNLLVAIVVLLLLLLLGGCATPPGPGREPRAIADYAQAR